MAERKQGRTRTMSICLSDIPKERILSHENGKLYLSVQTYDYDEPDKYDNDFSISCSKTKDEIERSKAGEKINLHFIGNGRIWEDKDKTKPASTDEVEKKLDWLTASNEAEKQAENSKEEKENDVPF